ncbi:MAG TPA: glycoside hydrolase family 3 N-terminal domain-containing protein [Candidatus Saccharimonadales bacterium]|nr:glycoside hydrolase family 3 N-terminal domain-containing protein [Candidatus Saccharimonadales bacterium]
MRQARGAPELRHLGRLFMAPVPRDRAALRALDEARVPHCIVFRRDFAGLPALRQLNARLIARAARLGLGPPLLALDEEGGLVSQLRAAAWESPGPRVLARGGDAALARASGRAVARALRSLGFNLNFAPVADVDTARNSPVIGARAVSGDPAEVARWCAAWIHAHQAAGVAATGKHFPGHGAAEADSHLTLPEVRRPRALLKRLDLPPFLAAARAGVAAVMTAHVRYPELDPGRAATFSPRILGLLRGPLGFAGLVVTDSLEMAGARGARSGEEAVRALLAGCDLLLYAAPGDRWQAGWRAVQAAVRAGRVAPARVEEALARGLQVATAYRARPARRAAAPGAGLRRAWDRAARAALYFSGLAPGAPAGVEVFGRGPQAAELAAALRRHGVDARPAEAGPGSGRRAGRSGRRSGRPMAILVLPGRTGWERAEAAWTGRWRAAGRPFGVVSLLSPRRLEEPPARGAIFVACPFEDTHRALEAVAARVAEAPPRAARRASRH